MTRAGTPNWIVCQIGAREHYAVARGLARVGADVRLITDYWGGAGDGTSAMNRRLKQRCHSEIDNGSVLSFNFGFLLTEIVAKMRRLRSWDRYRFTNQWFGRQAAGRLRKLVDTGREPPTVFAYSYAAKFIFSEAKRLGCRTVLGQIDPGPEEDRIVAELDRKAGLSSYVPANESYWEDWRIECESADVVVANSNWSRECLIKSGLAAEKIRVVELAFEESASPATNTDVDSIPDRFDATRPLRVLFLGQLNVRKGAVELADAISRMTAHPVEWTLVGRAEPAIERRFEGCSKARRIDHVSREEVAGYYRSADVFILPTHSDGFAITQLEAAAAGIPIIASRFCGDVVEDGVNGFRLQTVTADSINEAVFRLLDQPSLLRSMKQALGRRELRGIADVGHELIQI